MSVVKIIFLSFYLFGSIIIWISAKDIQVVFWVEPMHTDVFKDISDSLSYIKDLYPDAQMQGSTFVVDAENSDEDKAETLKFFCDVLSKNGISVVLDFTFIDWVEGLQQVHFHNIPYLRIERVLSPFFKMLTAFLKEKLAHELLIILESKQHNDEAIYEMVEGFPFMTLVVNGIDDPDFVKHLQTLRPSPSYYIVIAKTPNMNIIFKKLYHGKIYQRPTEWHFVFLDNLDHTFKYKEVVESSTKFQIDSRYLCQALQMKNSYCRDGFTLRKAMLLQLLRSLVTIYKSNKSYLRPSIRKCNKITTSTNVTKNFKIWNHFPPNQFIKFITKSLNAKVIDDIPYVSYFFNATITTYMNEPEVPTTLAVWENGKLRKINETITQAKRYFRIGVTESIPWNYYRRDKVTNEIILDNNGNPIWEGYCIDLIVKLTQKLNCEYDLVEPKVGTFGEKNRRTTKWNGLIGDLVSGETNFAVAALKMYAEREEVIDYIAPYFEQTGISIVMRKPVREKSLFKFMTVLRFEVWMSILGALVGTASLIWFLDKYSPYSAQNNKAAYPYPCRKFTFRESLWFALTSFTPQGGGEAPKSISARILVASYWLFVVLMLATFTANLAAFLTVERMQTPVQSLEQLGRQSRINYTVVAGSDTHQHFINMKFAEDTLYRMWKELVLNATHDTYKYRVWDYPIKEQYGTILLAINTSQPVRNAAEGFQKVMDHENSDFAFIHDSAEIKYEISRNCNLTEVGEVFAEQPYAIAVQQGSNLADEISYAILELQKDRFFDELRAKYWNHSSQKNCGHSDDQGITLESLGGVFIATLFGLGLAMVTLVFEVLYHKRKNSKELNKIIDVKPALANPSTTEAPLSIETNYNMDKVSSPPTSQATFRGKKIPTGVTLGGEYFKPRRTNTSHQELERVSVEQRTDTDTALPPYIE